MQRPRWLAVERVYVKHVWRASQQAYRWWATMDCTAITLDKISDPFKVCHSQSSKLALCWKVECVKGDGSMGAHIAGHDALPCLGQRRLIRQLKIVLK